MSTIAPEPPASTSPAAALPAWARLPARLEATLAEVGPCGLLVDLCADHARLATAAVARGVAERAVAVDLHAAPLSEARRRLAATGLADRVSLLRADGLAALRTLARAHHPVLAIAGVGGDLCAQLLERSGDALGIERIVVQPERHAREVRAWMHARGFHLLSERVIAERRRLHLLLRFQRSAGADACYGNHPLEAELLLGPRLLASAEPAAQAWLRREHRRLVWLGVRRPDLIPALTLLDARFDDRRRPGEKR